MDAVADLVIEFKTVVVAAWFALFFAGERLHSLASATLDEGGGRLDWTQDWPRAGRNIGLFAVNALISPLLVLPISAAAATLGLGLRPDWWPLVFDILVLELWIYWWHRANHEVPLLWRFHQVHHLDRFLDTTTAVRFHFGELLLSALARAPVVILFDIPIASVVVFETLILVAAIFHHSNLRLPPQLEAALSRVVITPSIHWVHHHRVKADTDSNYGTVFSFWDRLFHTRSATPRTPDMAIGVEARDEQPLVGLFLRPFRPS